MHTLQCVKSGWPCYKIEHASTHFATVFHMHNFFRGYQHLYFEFFISLRCLSHHGFPYIFYSKGFRYILAICYEKNHSVQLHFKLTFWKYVVLKIHLFACTYLFTSCNVNSFSILSSCKNVKDVYNKTEINIWYRNI